MFSVFIMRQTTIVVSEKRVFCERPRVLSNAQEKTLSQHDKRNFWYSLPRKKVSFWYGNLLLFRIFFFKNRSFSSGQGVVQIEPNSVWASRLYVESKTKRIFAIASLGKNLVFHTEMCNYFE